MVNGTKLIMCNLCTYFDSVCSVFIHVNRVQLKFFLSINSQTMTTKTSRNHNREQESKDGNEVIGQSNETFVLLSVVSGYPEL